MERLVAVSIWGLLEQVNDIDTEFGAFSSVKQTLVAAIDTFNSALKMQDLLRMQFLMESL